MKRVDRDPAVKSPNTKQVHNTALFVLLYVFFVPSFVCSRAFIIMALIITILCHGRRNSETKGAAA